MGLFVNMKGLKCPFFRYWLFVIYTISFLNSTILLNSHRRILKMIKKLNSLDKRVLKIIKRNKFLSFIDLLHSLNKTSKCKSLSSGQLDASLKKLQGGGCIEYGNIRYLGELSKSKKKKTSKPERSLKYPCRRWWTYERSLIKNLTSGGVIFSSGGFLFGKEKRNLTIMGLFAIFTSSTFPLKHVLSINIDEGVWLCRK